jgi:hypothetical protein
MITSVNREPTMNATQPLDVVRTWSEEQKESVLLTLLREALHANENDPEPYRIDDENGTPIGSVTLRKYTDDDHPPRVTPEEEMEFIRRVRNRERMLSEEEFLEWVRTVPLAEAK